MSDTINYQTLTFLGFPLYRVGTDGSVWSRQGFGPRRPDRDQERWRRLRPQPCGRGHRFVALFNATGRTSYLVHRLVLEAFVGPCPEGMECRHLNGIASDNRLENLCWGTHLENGSDLSRHGKNAHPSTAKIPNPSVDVPAIYEAYYLRRETLRVIAERYEVTSQAISYIVRGISYSQYAPKM